MSIRRFQIAEESMLPTLVPGQEILASDSHRPRVGDIAVFPHPGKSDFWLVKRVAEPPHPLDDGRLWVLSDNSEATRADSRTLGSIDRASALKRVDRLDADTFSDTAIMLAAEDPALASTIEDHGMPEFWHRPPGFRSLVLLILEQQVSLESGAAVYRRVLDAAGQVTPAAIVQLGLEGLRGAGTTRQKASYIAELAEKTLSGEFDPHDLDRMSPGDARQLLISLRGIGLWTADAYLLSSLRHPDMWPVGDRALQVGTAEALKLDSVPDEEELEILGEPWRPARAVAARMIWHAYLASRGRVEPDNPLDDNQAQTA